MHSPSLTALFASYSYYECFLGDDYLLRHQVSRPLIPCALGEQGTLRYTNVDLQVSGYRYLQVERNETLPLNQAIALPSFDKEKIIAGDIYTQ